MVVASCLNHADLKHAIEECHYWSTCQLDCIFGREEQSQQEDEKNHYPRKTELETKMRELSAKKQKLTKQLNIHIGEKASHENIIGDLNTELKRPEYRDISKRLARETITLLTTGEANSVCK
jgi:hypothetical protein